MRKPKEEKKNPLYSLPSNLAFVMKAAWQMDKGLLFAVLARAPIVVLVPLLGTYLSKTVVQLVAEGAEASRLLLMIAALSARLLVCRWGDLAASVKVEWRSIGSMFQYLRWSRQKIMDLDYQTLEDPQAQVVIDKAMGIAQSNHAPATQVFAQVVQMGSNLLGLATYSTLIFAFSPWLALGLFGLTLANHFLNRVNDKWDYRNRDNWVAIDRKRGYIQRTAGDFAAAKDMRLYGMSGWFTRLFEGLLAERLVWSRRGERRTFARDLFGAGMTLIRNGAAYGFLIHAVATGRMSAAEFVLYFGLISQYADWLNGLMESYGDLHRTSLAFCDFREFIDLPDHFNRGPGPALPKTPPEIVFDQVTFRYPGGEADTLKGINLRINPGEKIALVGLNGAGKTTLVKLLCGLYRPTQGGIIVAGQDLLAYNRDEYHTMLSVVFQDIHLLPVSVAKNVALCPQAEIDPDKLGRVLHSAGLYEKVQSLPNRENTLLLKGIYDGAVEFSGGEKQKLALARALYKGGQIIVLDEPTAALDPIAENDIYQQYHRLTAETTSVFISHRLSSTRFCDRILFMEDGKIIEEGTHEALMKQGEKYAHMFDVQSHYYKEDPTA